MLPKYSLANFLSHKGEGISKAVIAFETMPLSNKPLKASKFQQSQQYKNSSPPSEIDDQGELNVPSVTALRLRCPTWWP